MKFLRLKRFSVERTTHQNLHIYSVFALTMAALSYNFIIEYNLNINDLIKTMSPVKVTAVADQLAVISWPGATPLQFIKYCYALKG